MSSHRPSQQFKLHMRAQIGDALVPHIRRNLRMARALLRVPLAELSLALVNDATMSKLHRSFMNIPGPTDVLTFELDHDRQGRVLSGEVILCVPEAKRQAKKLGTSVKNELLLYAIHGMLHLSGFDDRTKTGYQAMHRKEDQILRKLGIGNVFAAQKSRGSR